MLHKDFFMRQIQMMTEAVGSLIFNKKAATLYDISDEFRQAETDILYLQLRTFLNDNKINEAENLLFETINPLEANHFVIAIDFYEQLNKMSNAELEEHDFSKEEVVSGLNKINQLFNETYQQ